MDSFGRYFDERLTAILSARVAPGLRVLQIGCGEGQLLAALRPSFGVGTDPSAEAIATARERHEGRPLRFHVGDGSQQPLLDRLGGPFDVILLVNVITHLADVQAAFESLNAVCHGRTRLLIYDQSRLWQPFFWLVNRFASKLASAPEAWLPSEEVRHMLRLADYEIVRCDPQMLCPVRLPLASTLLNRYLGQLPGLRHLSLLYGVIARPAPHRHAAKLERQPTVSVVIPCRNEAGHIRELVSRLPELAPGSEYIFVEGQSTDDTARVIEAELEARPGWPLRLVQQRGEGKGDAVRTGISGSTGEIVLILDADMGVAPEDVPRFVEALVRGKGDLINGSRMVYPMDGRPMPFPNLVANKLFALLFSFLLGQQVRDTLCGTKALFREDYERIAAKRSAFGDFDPFGDFELLFGAARLNLRIVDLAVRYHERRYGRSNISRLRHGLILLRMAIFAARRLTFV